MTWANYDDVQRQLEAAGLVLDKQIAVDARIQRWKTADSKGGEKPGWSRLKEWQAKSGDIFIVGCFGVWSGTDDGYTKIELPRRDDPARPTLTDEDIAAARAAQKAAKKAIAEERKREAKQAAAWAAAVWSKCAPAVEHEYLARKGIDPCGTRIWSGADDLVLEGIDDANAWRLAVAKGALVVPMHDTGGTVCGIQFIFPKGHARAEKTGKEFWPTGMAMGGTFGLIGPLRRSGVLLVTEGFATAASLHLATGQSVAYAFSANNLGKAGAEIRKKHKLLRLLFCADDDYTTAEKTGKNPGVEAAQLAASEIEHAAWLAPDFMVEGSDIRGGKKLTDFNDLDALRGRLAVADQVNTKLDALKWRDAASRPTPGGALKSQGEGERGVMPSMLQVEDALDRIALVYGGKGTCFDFAEHMLVPLADVKEILPEHGWRDMRARKLVVRIDEVGFDPAGTDPRIRCNLWGGWPTVPKAGACERLLELLEYLCSDEQNPREIYQWVLKWLAYPIQHPGAKMRTALVFHGPQGTGKNLFFEAVMAIYGEYGRIIDQSAIEDKFNDWASRKLFLIADEVVARQELYHVKNKLKGIITGEWIRINPKNVAAHDERNHVNVVFLSNESQPLVLEKDDRRYTVIWTPQKLSEAFYAEVKEELKAGAVAALHDHLLRLPLGDFDEHTKPPLTDAKRALIDVSMDSVERFARDWGVGDVSLGPEAAPLPFCPAGTSDLYYAYTRWCRQEGVARPRELGQFLGQLAKRPGWVRGHKDRLKNFNSPDTVRQRMVVPAAADLEAAATKLRLPDYRRLDTESQTEWMTRCFFAFQNALGARE